MWISYNSAEYLKERHGLPPNLLPNIAVVETLATAAGGSFSQNLTRGPAVALIAWTCWPAEPGW